MRKMIATLLALVLVMSGLHGVAAQDSGEPFASGIDAPVTWMDASGNPVATLTLNEVVFDFQDYDPEVNSWPDFGYTYQMVRFTIENVSDKAIIIERGTFYLVDDFGNVHSDSGLRMADESQPLMEGDVALASGESVQHMGLYETPAHSQTQLFNWRPTGEANLLIAVSTEVPESSAMAWGMNAPSTVVDDFGNPIYSFEVTGQEAGWSRFSENDTPESGTSYYALHITVTNMNERPVVVDTFDYDVIDSTGAVVRAERVRTDDEEQAIAPLRTREELAPGESMDVMMVYMLQDGREPAVLAVRSSYNVMNTVILVEGAIAPTATPGVEATPSGN